MTWRTTLLALLAWTALAAPPTPFEQNGKWGYRTRQAVVIEPQFSVAWQFSPQGLAAVVDAEGWAYIDTKGNVVIRPYAFDNGPDYFRENLARFRVDGKFGFFDRRGRVVIPPQYDYAEPFAHGRARVCTGCREVAEGEHRSFTGGTWTVIKRPRPLP